MDFNRYIDKLATATLLALDRLRCIWIQQFAHSVMDNHLSLMIFLHVSSSKGSSSERYKRRHISAADFVKDVHVWN
jgi:hypothetical protein